MTLVDGDEVKVETSSLPWAHRYSLLLVAVPADSAGSEILPAALPRSDPASGRPTVLRPGERVCGAVLLAERFPNLAETLATRDVVVFWAYRFRNRLGRLEFYGGALPIGVTGRQIVGFGLPR